MLNATETIPSILPLLRSPHVLTSREAQKALVAFRATEILPFLENQLQDGNSSARLQALKGVIAIGGPTSIPVITKGLRDPIERNQLEALKGLFASKAKDQVQKIWEFLDQDVKGKAREYALAALLVFEEERAVPLALELLLPKEGRWNIRFYDVLFESQPRILVPSLVDMLNNHQALGGKGFKPAGFLSYAIDFLVQMEAKEAIPTLQQYAKNMKSPIQEKAIQGLGALQAREAVPDLLLLLRFFIHPTLDDIEALYPGFKERLKPKNGKTMAWIAFPSRPYPPNPGPALALIKIGERSAWPLILKFLEESKSFSIVWELNSWVNPELWQVLHMKTLQGYQYAPLEMFISSFQTESGIPIHIPDSLKKQIKAPPTWHSQFVKYWWPNRGDRIPLAQGVQEILGKINKAFRSPKDPYTFLFVGDEIHIMKVSEAINLLRENANFSKPS